MEFQEGNIVVLTHDGVHAGSWEYGAIHKITRIHGKLDKGGYFSSSSGDGNSSGLWCSSARLATAVEIEAYNQGIRNIKHVKPEVVSTYQIY